MIEELDRRGLRMDTKEVAEAGGMEEHVLEEILKKKGAPPAGSSAEQEVLEELGFIFKSYRSLHDGRVIATTPEEQRVLDANRGELHEIFKEYEKEVMEAGRS